MLVNYIAKKGHDDIPNAISIIAAIVAEKLRKLQQTEKTMHQPRC
jgi:hypothetical protein